MGDTQTWFLYAPYPGILLLKQPFSLKLNRYFLWKTNIMAMDNSPDQVKMYFLLNMWNCRYHVSLFFGGVYLQV